MQSQTQSAMPTNQGKQSKLPVTGGSPAPPPAPRKAPAHKSRTRDEEDEDDNGDDRVTKKLAMGNCIGQLIAGQAPGDTPSVAAATAKGKKKSLFDQLRDRNDAVASTDTAPNYVRSKTRAHAHAKMKGDGTFMCVKVEKKDGRTYRVTAIALELNANAGHLVGAKCPGLTFIPPTETLNYTDEQKAQEAAQKAEGIQRSLPKPRGMTGLFHTKDATDKTVVIEHVTVPKGVHMNYVVMELGVYAEGEAKKLNDKAEINLRPGDTFFATTLHADEVAKGVFLKMNVQDPNPERVDELLVEARAKLKKSQTEIFRTLELNPALNEAQTNLLSLCMGALAKQTISEGQAPTCALDRVANAHLAKIIGCVERLGEDVRTLAEVVKNEKSQDTYPNASPKVCSAYMRASSYRKINNAALHAQLEEIISEKDGEQLKGFIQALPGMQLAAVFGTAAAAAGDDFSEANVAALRQRLVANYPPNEEGNPWDKVNSTPFDGSEEAQRFAFLMINPAWNAGCTQRVSEMLNAAEGNGSVAHLPPAFCDANIHRSGIARPPSRDKPQGGNLLKWPVQLHLVPDKAVAYDGISTCDNETGMGDLSGVVSSNVAVTGFQTTLQQAAAIFGAHSEDHLMMLINEWGSRFKGQVAIPIEPRVYDHNLSNGGSVDIDINKWPRFGSLEARHIYMLLQTGVEISNNDNSKLFHDGGKIYACLRSAQNGDDKYIEFKGGEGLTMKKDGIVNLLELPGTSYKDLQKECAQHKGPGALRFFVVGPGTSSLGRRGNNDLEGNMAALMTHAKADLDEEGSLRDSGKYIAFAVAPSEIEEYLKTYPMPTSEYE